MSTTSSPFAFLHPILTKMVGPPTNTSIQILAREVLANARAIPSIHGSGAHGHLGLVMQDAAYRLLTGSIPFTLPAHPGNAPTPPAAGANQFEISEQIRLYKATIDELTRAATLRKELKKQILDAIDHLYLTILEDAIFGFSNVSVADMIGHLQTTYGTVTRTDLEKNRASIATLWTPSEPIELLWSRLREVQRIATCGNEPIADAAIVLSIEEGTLLAMHQLQKTHKHQLVHAAVEEYMERVLDDFEARVLACHQLAKKVVFPPLKECNVECNMEQEQECKQAAEQVKEQEQEHEECDEEHEEEQAVRQDVLLDNEGMKPVAIFDTPMKLKCGAKHIMEDINLDEFLLLHKVVGRLSTDLEIRCLQQELVALSGVIKPVDLQEFVSCNDKTRRMILVPRSRSYAGFCISA